MQKLKNLIPAYFLIFIVLAASWSLLSFKFFRVHDYTHAGRIVEMTRALSDGHFPVRWTQNFGFGYGMPLFEFYGPLPFYLGAIVYWLTANVVFSIKSLYLLSNIGTALGGYFLGKKLFGINGGLIVAASLTLAPYRAVNLFVRGALNEAWAIMFLPWILLGVVQLFHQEKRGWLTFSLGLTGLFLSHNITTMLFFPILLLFIIGYLITLLWGKSSTELYRKKRFRGLNFVRIMSKIAASGLLAIGLSSFYLIPAFFEKHYTQVENFILTAYFDYHLHFLYIRQFFTPNWDYGGSTWGVEDGISFFLGWGQWLAVLMFILLILHRLWLWINKGKAIFKSKQTLLLMILFGLLLSASLYMSLLKSQWLWDSVPLLEFAQFPWRWLGVGIVFLSLFLGSSMWLVSGKLGRTHLALVLVMGMIFGSVWYFKPESYLDNSADFYYTDPALIRKELSSVLPDYISASMSSEPTIIPDQLVINADELNVKQFSVLVDRTHEKLIETSFTEKTLVSLAVAEYPGWRVEVDNQRWDREHGVDGNIVVIVPPGEHLLTLRFLSTPVRMYADITSAISWLILILLLLPTTSKNMLKRNND